MLTHNIYSQDVFMADVFQICAAVEFDIAAARIPILPYIQSSEIDVCFTPNSGHSEAHAGLLLLTRSRHGSQPSSISAADPDPRCSPHKLLFDLDSRYHSAHSVGVIGEMCPNKGKTN